MGFFGNVTKTLDPVLDLVRPPKQPNPLDLLMNQTVPSSQDLYADALSQVGGAYQAQLGNLDAATKDAKRRQQQGDAQLNAMYSALAKDIGANQKNITGRYNEAKNTSKKGTAGTKAAINKTYSDTNNELGNLFSRLGIQAALPGSLEGSNNDRNLLSGLVDFSGNSAMNALGLNQAAASDFNTAQKNIAGLTGKNKRADLLTQLNTALSDIGSQRNTVYGQMSDAVNQRQYQLEQDALQQQQQNQEMILGLLSSGGGSSGSNGGLTDSQQYQMMGPNERARYKASTLVGDDGAAQAMNIINQVANYQNGGVYQNISHFIRSVIAENHKKRAAGESDISDEVLADLASYFWDQGGTGKTPPNQY